MRRPVLLFPERHGDLDLVPSLLLSQRVPPPRSQEEEGGAEENRPLGPERRGARATATPEMRGRERDVGEGEKTLAVSPDWG